MLWGGGAVRGVVRREGEVRGVMRSKGERTARSVVERERVRQEGRAARGVVENDSDVKKLSSYGLVIKLTSKHHVHIISLTHLLCHYGHTLFWGAEEILQKT